MALVNEPLSRPGVCAHCRRPLDDHVFASGIVYCFVGPLPPPLGPSGKRSA